MRVFDESVDDLRSGDTIIARYDTGLEIRLNYESLTIQDDESCFVISDDEMLRLLRSFLEVYVTAREKPLEINYDDLLSGNF